MTNDINKNNLNKHINTSYSKWLLIEENYLIKNIIRVYIEYFLYIINYYLSRYDNMHNKYYKSYNWLVENFYVSFFFYRFIFLSQRN